MRAIVSRLLGRSQGEPQMLQPGSKAHDFTCRTHDGRTVSLTDYRGRKVVLWFYPKADTPG